MLKQRKYYNKKKIFLFNFRKLYVHSIVHKSFKENHKQDAFMRLVFFQTNYTAKHKKYFYLTQQKLRCFLTYSKSVPNKNLLLSRFSLTKNTNKLTVGPFSK